MSEAALHQFYAALNELVGFEPVNQDVTDTRLRVIARIHPDKNQDWLIIGHRMIQAEPKLPIGFDFSKKYFDRGGHMLFGWRIIIQGEDYMKYLPQLVQVARGAPRARKRVDTAPLVGPSSTRNNSGGVGVGKGAASIA